MVLIRSDLPTDEKEILLSHLEAQLVERQQVLIDREQQLVNGKLELLGREERVREAQSDVKEREKAVAEREAALEVRVSANKETLVLPSVKSRKSDGRDAAGVKGGIAKQKTPAVDGESKAFPSQRARLAKALTRPPSKMDSQSFLHRSSSSPKSRSDDDGGGGESNKGKRKALASGGAKKIRKRPRNAFNFYCDEMRERLTEEAKAEQATENRAKNINAQLGRLAGAEWRLLPDENKSRYKAMAEEERKAFDAQEQIDIEQ